MGLVKTLFLAWVLRTCVFHKPFFWLKIVFDKFVNLLSIFKVSEGKERVLYIGITCGLSAPYVAGQLQYCMDNPQFIPVLVGFNPENLARWKSFYYNILFKGYFEYLNKSPIKFNSNSNWNAYGCIFKII